MEHIEEAGIHSGDSACVLPPVSIPEKHRNTIEDYTRRIAIALGVKGLINIQYAIADGTVYVLEANPRASRTVPLVSKVCGINMVRCATEIMMGKSVAQLGLTRRQVPHFGVKEAVFPFSMYHEVDPVLGPEMRSTGEVLGLAETFPLAFYKAQEGAKQYLPSEGTVLLSISDADKAEAIDVARAFVELGFKLRATEGTHEHLRKGGIASEAILKLHEGRPNITDVIADGGIQLVINTPVGTRGSRDDSYIRKSAVKHKLPYVTTMAAARAAAKAIAAVRAGKTGIKSLQEYHAAIK
jgi:carbamoyl-phosphate synthase large subunit